VENVQSLLASFGNADKLVDCSVNSGLH